ncbi:phage tail assembly chaperone [Paenibacillus naphthalenovorans]|uniref:phage tail assembly chaperone n=1 Tax=Paenibacillus naphthalenovorans TaxID=162209 RepID=UPI00088E573F|nr:phage portal protein [Paenibacillus naphthalenovorans]SDJ76363.1 Phage XkdN-like tail assembly chaperone protein, TAC [Paenibacillus naphthalenovorans]
MSDLSVFFAGNAAVPETEEFVVSERFKDKEGKPIHWQFRPISEEENDAIRASATRKVKGKNGVMVPETNTSEYLAKLAAACVVYPNLNDAELQKSYGVRGADVLIRKMLLSGEYAGLIGKIQEINGFDKDINDLAEEVKN